uniref:Uncharacterized protein n=1 Tax=Arundo donax TaxID=35708 RepID=A0A0A9CFV2_ARUDO
MQTRMLSTSQRFPILIISVLLVLVCPASLDHILLESFNLLPPPKGCYWKAWVSFSPEVQEVSCSKEICKVDCSQC